jgi:uncharacterized protein (DUF2384 family)
MIKVRTSVAPTEEPASGPVTGSAFWALMARWDVPDAQALQLIGQPPSASGKRPRFALNPDQAERLALLREVDRHATDIYQDAAGWLQRVNRSTMFGGRSPVDYMARKGREGIEAVLVHLNKMTFSGSVAAKPRRR